MAEQKPELVGLGVTVAIGKDVDQGKIWASMVDKIYHPDKFLPVSNVKSEDKDGYVYREMTARGEVIKENIYSNEVTGEIAFVDVGNGETVYNVYHKSEGTIEYWRSKSRGGERIFWEAPASAIRGAIQKTVDFASQ
eukprot:TRINITY_DN2248_c0_g1_i1.p1 TRINITY_DN2248_c0_g1~~TRINITY_DN2248_c0_g1_i1.p1  ORF type:complete len:137 (+),score=41.25 TRINITY_DN2248_c0_g1_i1:136-546(+)